MRRVLVGCLILALCALCASPAWAGEQGRAVIRELSAIPDRTPGSPGSAEAAAFMLARLERLASGAGDIASGVQTFRVARVEREGATLTLKRNGHSVRPKQLASNALAPGAIAPPGHEGPAIYVGSGELLEFTGLDAENAVVLMDLRSGKRWNNAAMLGARAIVFVGPHDDVVAARNLFSIKYEPTPVDLPFFWLSETEAEALMGAGFREKGPRALGDCRLTSKAYWKRGQGENVWVHIPGSDPDLRDELLIVQAFHDAGGWVAGASPGADQAASAAALAEIAAMFAESPPARSVLLLSAGASAQSQLGMREFTQAFAVDEGVLKERREELRNRLDEAEKTLTLLSQEDPLAGQKLSDAQGQELLRKAFRQVVRDREDVLTTDLMRLRLLGKQADQKLIKRLADKRMTLKRLQWVQSTGGDIPLGEAEKELLLGLRGTVERLQRRAVTDAREQMGDLVSLFELRKLLDGRPVAAHVGLHLSSRGDAVGGFDKGWLYHLKPQVNRTRFFSGIHDVMLETAQAQPAEIARLFEGTLRPNAARSWQSYLPDNPELGGEPMAIAGLPGFTLATLHDARSTWNTPFDTTEKVNFGFLDRQSRLVRALVGALAQKPLPDVGKRGKNRYSTLTGRANLLRKGEIFPDKPGTDGVMLTFQWTTRMYSMVDTKGSFRVPGLANKKISYHKAVIEGFGFDPQTGLASWAINKPKTGKPNYRVKINRPQMETGLTLFNCSQTTLFDMFDPRTFKYLYRPKLIDARTEAPPLNYWYSRLDTRWSTLGTLFLEPDTPIKLTLSDTVIDKKVLLLNATEDHPLGKGYVAENWPVIPQTEYRAARDMWNLLAPRIDALESRGIVNDRIRALWQRGLDDLNRAKAQRESKDWRGFVEASRASLSKASRVYSDVDRTQRDVLVGVLFYVALFIPFAYCMERLVFGFADIKKRICGFLGMLAVVIAAVYAVHPAFDLTYSPLVVILAFFILGLSLLVGLIIFFRFEREMVELQRRSRHVKISNLSATAAFGAAFALGVGNLRRRPVRTALTLATLTILTFTIMNFTTVKSVREKGWAKFSDTASYSGLMLKYFNWQDMPLESLSVVRSAWGREGVIAPRAWYAPHDMSRAPLIPVTRGEDEAPARGVVGLSHLEPMVSGLDDILVKGRWFRSGETGVVLLPERIAQELGVDPEDPARNQVIVWGYRLTVTGVFSDTGLRDHPDLDGEPMTPIVYPNEAAARLSDVEAEAIDEGEEVATYESRYRHIPGYETIIIPSESLLSLGGGAGKLKAIAVKPLTDEMPGGELGDRFGLMLFRGGPEGTSLFYTADAVSYGGVANILIPVLISILIVLNTMIGSVYERKGEIAVYTSIGLAPPHVAFLFIAESLAFAVISVVFGYLLAQGAAAFLAGTPLWAGMTANYSSTAGVAAMLLVIAVALVSSIYPAKVAARIAIPDVNRSWSMPEPKGDTLTIVLPFLIKLHEQFSAGGFLREYYMAHHDVSHGAFCTDEVECTFVDRDQAAFRDDSILAGLTGEQLDNDDFCFDMNLRAWLAPFDFGVRQKVHLIFCPSDIYKGFRQVRVTITREAGEAKAWQNLNRTFINDLRKQLLAWRSLDEEAVESYAGDLRTHIDDTLMKKAMKGDEA